MASEDQSIAEKKQLASAFAGFRQSDTYKFWAETVTGQIDGRMTKLVQPLKSPEDVWEQEFSKGEIQGLQLALNLFTLLEDGLRVEIERQPKKEDDNE